MKGVRKQLNITITGRHFSVTEPLKEYANDKVYKLKKYFDRIVDAHVILEVNKYRHIAELTILARHLTITRKEESNDMYAAIDRVISNIEKQLIRYRDRIKTHKIAQRRIGPGQVPEADVSEKPAIIRVKHFAAKPMSIDEAAMELELFDNEFIVFKNSENNRVNVIYRMKDGNYGLVEPDF